MEFDLLRNMLIAAIEERYKDAGIVIIHILNIHFLKVHLEHTTEKLALHSLHAYSPQPALVCGNNSLSARFLCRMYSILNIGRF